MATNRRVGVIQIDADMLICHNLQNTTAYEVLDWSVVEARKTASVLAARQSAV